MTTSTSRSRTPRRSTAAPEASDGIEVVGKPRQSPAEIDQDLHIPLSSRAVFWQPRHLALSDALLHVPYLFWLMETCRPANVVQIGTGDGIAYMAICQAVDKLSMATPCLGLNPDADGPALPEAIAAQHQSHYDDFSRVIHDDPAQAVRHVRERTIDLLVLNTTLTDERVMALRAHWQSRLSGQAVVVIINPDRQATTPAAREFVDSLARACPGIRLQQADSDIETYLVGQDQPERLKKLAEQGMGTPGYLAARQVFSRLGQGLYQGQRAHAAQAEAEKARKAATGSHEQLHAREEEVATQRRQAELARQAEAELAGVASDLQARLFDTQTTLEALRKDFEESQKKREAFFARVKELEALNDARQAEQETARAALAKAEERAEALRARNEALEAENAGLTVSLDERMADIVALSEGFEKRLEDRMGDIAALTGDYEKRLKEAGAEREAIAARLAESDQKRRDFLEAKRELQTTLKTEQERHAQELRDRDGALAAERALQEQNITQLAKRDLALAKQAGNLEKALNTSNALQETVNRLTGEIQVLTLKLDENERERDALLNSTSWRLTKPMREVKLLLSG